MREKVTGKLLTLDRDLEPILSGCSRSSRCRSTTPRGAPSTRLGGAVSARSRRSDSCSCARLARSRSSSSSRTSTGSTPRPRPSSTLWSTASRSRGSYFSSTTAPSTSTGGAARPTTRSSGSTPSPTRAPRELLGALLGERSDTAPLNALLIDQTDGNPFFLRGERAARWWRLACLTGERGAYRLTQSGGGDPGPRPPSRRSWPRASTGCPPAEKSLLQSAAVIGKDVPFRCCGRSPRCRRTISAKGLHLQAAEFLYETSLFPELEYTFKHALTHEVAYGSLLHERRRALHTRILAAMESVTPTGWLNTSSGWRTTRSGRTVGQGRRLLPAGRSEGGRTLGKPGCGDVLRASPGGAEAPSRHSGAHRAGD